MQSTTKCIFLCMLHTKVLNTCDFNALSSKEMFNVYDVFSFHLDNKYNRRHVYWLHTLDILSKMSTKVYPALQYLQTF